MDKETRALLDWSSHLLIKSRNANRAADQLAKRMRDLEKACLDVLSKSNFALAELSKDSANSRRKNDPLSEFPEPRQF